MFAGIFLLGLLLIVCGVVLVVVLSLSPVHGSMKAAAWMVAIGCCLCLADFLLLLWVAAQIGD
jgi:hypothetical protein